MPEMFSILVAAVVSTAAAGSPVPDSANTGLFRDVRSAGVVGLMIATDSNGNPGWGPRIAGAVRRTWDMSMVGDCYAGNYTFVATPSTMDGVIGRIGVSGARPFSHKQVGDTFNNGESDAAVADCTELRYIGDGPDGFVSSSIGVSSAFGNAYAQGRWYGASPLAARFTWHISTEATAGASTWRAQVGTTLVDSDHNGGNFTLLADVPVSMSLSSPSTVEVLDIPGITIPTAGYPALLWRTTDDDDTGTVFRFLQHQLYDPAATSGLDLRGHLSRNGGGVFEFASEAGGPDGGISDVWLASHFAAARWPNVFLIQWGQNESSTDAWQDACRMFMDRVDGLYTAAKQSTPIYIYCAAWKPVGNTSGKYADMAQRLYDLAQLPANLDRMVFINGFQLMEDIGGITGANVHFNSTTEADLWGAAVWQQLNAAPCPWDCTPPGGNGVVNIDDILAIISGFGSTDLTCDVAPDNGDGTFGNGTVNIDDLLAVISRIGDCP